MRKAILLAIISIFTSWYVSAYQEVSCSQYGANANSCDQCFDGGSKYTGDTFQVQDVFNAGSNDRIYFDDENQTVYSFNTLNANTTWYVSNNLLEYPSSLTWYTQSSSGRDYLQFLKNTNTKFLQTVPGKGIRLQSVATDTVNPNVPAFKFTFIANYRTFANGTLGAKETHKECVFYKANYCGDGIVQTGKGETCDPKDTSKTGWGNGGCDTNTCKPITVPQCKGLTVTPNSGQAIQDVSATCTGYKVNTWEIDCGNGQKFTGTGNNAGDQSFTRTCKYTTGGNYTPTCKINGTITNNSCKAPVTISNPTPSIVVDKKDANASDLDGSVGNDTQTIYSGNAAIFKITVKNNGQEALKNVNLVDPIETACASNGTVNLAGATFTNQKGQSVNIVFAGSGNHTDNILQVGETFTYTCKKTNVTENLTNTVTARGVGVISGTGVNDSDPTVVKVVDKPLPEITVTKRDNNQNDLDKNIGGNDSQTVAIGAAAVFNIQVRNTGTEDLKDIVLIDDIAPACASNGTVNLKAKTFTNKNGATVAINVWGEGNHTDNILQVGEVIGYNCSKGNTTADYTNVVKVQGTGVTTGTKVTDDDPTKVVVKGQPSIQVDKLDQNSNDLDGLQHNDTQTVVKGEEAVFYIRVVNNGDENLKNITLTDAQASACGTKTGTFVNLQNASFINTDGVTVKIFPDGAGNHSDNIFQIGEEFTYTCQKANTQANYTNVVKVNGVGVTTGKTVTDSDDTVVKIETGVYDLALRKTVKTQSDSEVVFQIDIFNQGNIDAKSIVITDYIPTGLTLADTNWTLSGNKASRTVTNIPAGTTKTITIKFAINANAPKTMINYAEISSDDGDDCDSIPDATNGNQTGETPETGMVDDAIGNGCNPGGDEDDHDKAVITLGEGKIQLIKSLKSGNEIDVVAPGGLIEYVIKVKNIGTTALKDQRVEDHFPADFTLEDANWSLDPNRDHVAVYKERLDLAVGQEITLYVTFRLSENPQYTEYKNRAGVCDDSESDCNPNPPTDCDDAKEEGNPDGCQPIKVEKPSVQIDKTDENPNDQNSTDDIQKVNKGEEAIFKIRVTNNGTESLKDIVITDSQAPACAGLVTLPGTYPSTWSDFATGGTGNKTDAVLEPGEWFEYTCEKDNTQSAYTNIAKVDATGVISGKDVEDEDDSKVEIPSGGGGGGGSTYQCTGMTYGTGTVRCEGNSKVQSFYLKCGGTTIGPVNATQDGGERYAVFNCTSDVVQCYVYNKKDADIDGNAWRSWSECRDEDTGGGGGGSYCGNGIIEPNKGEQCDFGKNNGKPGYACSSSCKFDGGGGGNNPDCSNKIGKLCISTIPSEGALVFNPEGDIILGHGQNPFTRLGITPTLYNDSWYDLAFDQLCVKNFGANGDSSLKGSEACISLKDGNSSSTDGVIYPYETITMPASKVTAFTADKAGIPTGKDYGSAVLKTSIKVGGRDYYNAYFAADLNVRVARPAIVTTGGGTSYVKDSSTTSDVQKVTEGVKSTDSNTNFVGTSVTSSDSWLSSQSGKEITSNDEASSAIEKDNEITKVDTSSVTSSNAFVNYNGLTNVKVVKGNYTLKASDISGITQPTTFIVEQGNLTIPMNILLSDNVAFVVRGGDLIIDASVTNLKGTYIAIKNAETNVGGNIRSNARTDKQLTVNGSLYGNVAQLVESRDYIDGSKETIGVGTIVSFGSSLFSKPAPLISQFITEYMNSTKVAQ